MRFSSLQGSITASYDELVAAFGDPQFGPDESSADEKVTCEWEITLEGQDCRIYDWKEYTGRTPRGRYEWHIGGYDRDAVRLVHRAFDGPTTDVFAGTSNSELEHLGDCAQRLADWAEETGDGIREDLHELSMKFERTLRERLTQGKPR